MVAKCVRKLMFKMIEFLILILLSVQANDCAPTSFFLSLPPIMPSDSSKLVGEIFFCLHEDIEYNCAKIKNTWPSPDFEYETCIFLSFKYCLHKYFHEDRLGYHVISSCIRKDCLPKSIIGAIVTRSVQFVSCLLECYKEYLEKALRVKSS
jgi:hypothetical protein